MSTALTIRVNTSANDAAYSGSPSDFTTVDTDNDYLILSAGSDSVADGEVIPSETERNRAGTVITTSNVIVDKYLLADVGSNILREIQNAGNQDKQYVFCFSFDGETASEPALELWDDSDMDSYDLYSLGEGEATDSWWKGVVTTDDTPGDDWAGLALAGSEDNHFLWLNNGAGASPLDGAKDLYCNLKVVVPASFQYSGAETPVIVVKYTSN